MTKQFPKLPVLCLHTFQIGPLPGLVPLFFEEGLVRSLTRWNARSAARCTPGKKGRLLHTHFSLVARSYCSFPLSRPLFGSPRPRHASEGERKRATTSGTLPESDPLRMVPSSSSPRHPWDREKVVCNLPFAVCPRNVHERYSLWRTTGM